jgi:cytochrome c oxidase assembly factor CtaG
MRTLIPLAGVIALIADPAAAHGDEAHGAAPEWTFDPWILAPLLLVALLYGAGSLKIARRSLHAGPMFRKQSLAFWSGWGILAGALVSPLHWLGEHMFTFHMIEHELVMAVAAPLIVLARPVGPLAWGLPRAGRQCLKALFGALRKVWSMLTSGPVATGLHGLAIWIWHAPPFFDAAVTNVTLHRLQHLSFFLTAVVFWWSVLWVESRASAAWRLFVTMIHTSILGALMAFAPHILYASQTRAAMQRGLTPLEDQQLAGILMWVPGGTIYAGGALVLLMMWISTSSQGGRHGKSLRAS